MDVSVEGVLRTSFAYVDRSIGRGAEPETAAGTGDDTEGGAPGSGSDIEHVERGSSIQQPIVQRYGVTEPLSGTGTRTGGGFVCRETAHAKHATQTTSRSAYTVTGGVPDARF